MQSTRESSVVCTSSSASLALMLAVLVFAEPVRAQKQPLAIYPLLTDVLDATNTHGPVMLTGNPTPPAAPANGVCVNGIYSLSAGGQDVRTPMIPNLNSTDFQVDVEFNIAALPSSVAPVLMGGYLYRWIGIYLQANGTVGLKYNNSNLTWSTTILTTGKWYIGSIKFEAGTVELVIDGRPVHQFATGVLNTGGHLNFTTNDFSNGRSHNGCIRNLVISNDATLGMVASATNYGSGCDNLAMSANGLPSLGNGAFGLKVSNVKPGSPLVYVALGAVVVNPGLDLTVIGMAGCFSYTSLDIGVGPAVAIGGTATVALPIPNLPSLSGVVLFTQGIASTPATSFGLATSNGTQLVLGI